MLSAWPGKKNILMCKIYFFFLHNLYFNVFLFFVSPLKNTITLTLQNNPSFQQHHPPSNFVTFGNRTKACACEYGECGSILVISHGILRWLRRNCTRMHYPDER